MKSEEELNRVYCQISYFPTANRLLVNDKICKKLTKQAIERIKSFGIHCVEEQRDGYGGGDEESLLEIVKMLWEHKEYMSILVATISFAKRFFDSRYGQLLPKRRPALVIFLKIRKHKPFTEDDWHGPIGEKLKDLKYLSHDLYEWFSSKYPIYSFDQNIGMSICPRNFRISVIQRSSQENPFNNARIIQLLPKTNIIDNLDIDIRFSTLFLKRIICPTNCDDGSWSGPAGKIKTYYTFLTGNLITKLPRY